MIDWQPIETAPKDGVSILAFHPSPYTGGRIATMIWDGTGWRADIHSFVKLRPTHWMPLPKPPVKS